MVDSVNETELEQQELRNLRDAIDGIDDKLLQLINDRAQLAHKIDGNAANGCQVARDGS